MEVQDKVDKGPEKGARQLLMSQLSFRGSFSAGFLLFWSL